MPEPTAALSALRASTADLLLGLDAAQWGDADLAAPSLCAHWTRGHVLTHLARNADGIAATLSGALRGEVVARYPSREQRDADICAGARRGVGEVVADVRASAERLDRVLGAVAEADAWERPTDEGRAAQEWAARRCCEVEIHRVDLDMGYTADRWPPLFVVQQLPAAADTLTERARGPLRVEVLEQGSVSPEFVGQVWTCGEADGQRVAGPDWAVLSWLVGRPSAAVHELSATPPLAPWK